MEQFDVFVSLLDALSIFEMGKKHWTRETFTNTSDYVQKYM